MSTFRNNATAWQAHCSVIPTAPSHPKVRIRASWKSQPTVLSNAEGPTHGPAGGVVPTAHSTAILPGLGVEHAITARLLEGKVGLEDEAELVPVAVKVSDTRPAHGRTLQRPWTQMSLVSVLHGVPSTTRSLSW